MPRDRAAFALLRADGAFVAEMIRRHGDDAQKRRWLEGLAGVPGRFERVDAGQPFTVLVDYAHTPDSLDNLLRAARAVTGGRVIVVFGCGGDRDRAKRPLMGEIAGRLADVAVVTSDNPRSEDPGAIVAQVAEGVARAAGPRSVGVVGIIYLFYGSLLMLRETRMANATINAEMDFTWQLARELAPKELGISYDAKGRVKKKNGPKVSKTLGGE